MSFDKPTRNALAKMVGECRRLLTEDIRHQLQAVYGLQPDGTALAVSTLAHLEERGQEVARALREWQEHLASSEAGTDTEKKKKAFDRLAHETAFTVLNRLAALRMCEERGHVIECARRGMESDGFVLYERVSGGALGTRDETYRIFLERMFDELAVDLGALFDLRDPQSLVFPREPCLEKVLTLLNDPKLGHLWTEDETIGWVYQYFNSKEEREKMREESPAPRNSRELAVRNQFFTPRYVVEFLVDNTLGRIWYEMRKGETGLKDLCRYLVRRPTEIFLKQGQDPPASAEPQENLSQEKLLKQPVYIPHRPKKDPRDVKILDPACGSGHFLLYCFDLLETIYEEAWGDGQPVPSEATGKGLREEFPDLESLRKALPELILRRNLHGIDIDLRACQIAALALWLRGQRSHQQLGLKGADRPKITRSNIVCAEPMPGEKQLLEQFLADLQPKIIGQLVERVFEKMKLAGEAGSLLKIEEELGDAMGKAKKQWLEQPKQEQMSLFPRPKQQKSEQQALFDLSGITDEQFWQEAEERVLEALKDYAERVSNGQGLVRRLFADDAARGFAFIDLCRKRYDVVLMNPPFGLPTAIVFEFLQFSYPDTFVDIYGAFVERGLTVSPAGLVGAITPRTFIAATKMARWRKNSLCRSLELLADFGIGVMDDAMVRSCAYVVRHGGSPFGYVSSLDLRISDKAEALSAAFSGQGTQHLRCVSREFMKSLPDNKILYFVGPSLAQLMIGSEKLEPKIATVRKGMTTFDDERYLRLRWEVRSNEIGQGKGFDFYAKGGDYSNYYTNIHLLVNRRDECKELCETNRQVNGQTAQVRQGSSYYYLRGCQYTTRSKGFSARAVPDGCVMSSNAPMILTTSSVRTEYLLGWVNSRIIRSVIEMQSMADDFIPGTLKSLPWIGPDEDSSLYVGQNTCRLVQLYRHLASLDETDPFFAAPLWRDLGGHDGIAAFHCALLRFLGEAYSEIRSIQSKVSSVVDFVYGIDSVSLGDEVLGRDVTNEITHVAPSLGDVCRSVLAYTLGCAFGRYDALKHDESLEYPRVACLFDRLPACPPGQLQNEQGLPLTQDDVRRLQAAGKWHYPLDIPWEGILVDDPGVDGTQPHRDDIVRRVRQVLTLIWKDRAEAIEQEACEILEVKDLREYFRKPALFFTDHLKRYSKSRRQAPIYWPFSTASGSYTLWVYYHRLNDDLLYTALNRYVRPKIDEVEKQLRQIESDLPGAAGRAASKLRDTFEDTRVFLEELREFRDELQRVANLPYKPDLNDGVLITASPLWKLLRLPKWRKDLEECWKKLAAGDYDWAHLAYSIRPDRVREVCKRDRSIAIAHDLENLCEVPAKPAKKKGSLKQEEEAEESVLGDEE